MNCTKFINIFILGVLSLTHKANAQCQVNADATQEVTQELVVNITTGIWEEASNKTTEAYLNPVFNTLTLKHSHEDYEFIRVYDLLGDLVYQWQIHEHHQSNEKVDMSALPNGIYTIKLVRKQTKKVQKGI